MELSQLCKSVNPSKLLCSMKELPNINVTELGCPSTFSARIETVLEEDNAEDTESE